MKRQPSAEMRASIQERILQISRNGQILFVDGIAEEIQAFHPRENIALEDITDYITRVAIDHQVGIALPRQTELSG